MNQSKTIKTYIEEFPENIQNVLQQVYNAAKEVLPGTEETISYGMPTFKLDGKNIVHFAAFKNHIGFYPTPDGINEFQKELSQYKGAKGSVQFPLDKPMPLDLIKRMILFRLNKVKEKVKKSDLKQQYHYNK